MVCVINGKRVKYWQETGSIHNQFYFNYLRKVWESQYTELTQGQFGMHI